MTSHAVPMPGAGRVGRARRAAVADARGERTASAPRTVAEAMARVPVDRLRRRVVTSARPEEYVHVTPLTGEEIARLPLTSAQDVEFALSAARSTQRSWMRLPLRYRAAVLLRLHDLVLDRQDMLLDLVQIESGKARRHALEEVVDVALVARHYGRASARYLRPRGHAGLVPGLTSVRETYAPLGVIGVVSPWDHPLSLAITDLVPALVAGNTVVLRPAAQGALTALAVADLLAEAGLPDGVLQVVLGDGATTGAAVLEGADYAAFTGGTATGRQVAAALAGGLVGASLGLGGKNTVYVAEDADLDRAVAGVRNACFASAGQLCLSTERLVLHEAVADEFLARFVPAVEGMRLGASLGYGAEMGTLVDAARLAAVEEHVADAVAHGATVLTGGRARPDVAPYAYAPTLLAGVTPEMRVYSEETFGPVVSTFVVGSDAEAVRLANDTRYGLGASVWTRSPSRGRTVASAIRAGAVNVNEGYAAAWSSVAAPLAGVQDSGYGLARHGAEGIRRFTRRQTVAEQRVIGLGVPAGMDDARFAELVTAGLRLAKAIRLR